MGTGKIKIDCQKLLQLGKALKRNSSEFANIRKEMNESNNQIPNCWASNDSALFMTRFNSYIESLQEIERILNERGELLIQAASKHGAIDEELNARMKRVDINE